jgi:phosphoserine phosphatase
MDKNLEVIMVKLGIFDIDYTITGKETLVEFYKFMLRKKPKLIKHLPSTLVSGALYVSKRIELKKAKESFLSFVEGIHEEEMNALVKEFYEKRFNRKSSPFSPKFLFEN